MQLWGLARQEAWYISTFLCVLRLPGIALLDIWWMDHSYFIPLSLDLEDVADSGFRSLLLILALSLLLLPLDELVTVYAHFLALSSLGLAFLIATQFVEDERHHKSSVSGVKSTSIDLFRRHLCPAASYIALTHFTSWCCNLTNPVFKRVCPALYILPLFASIFGSPLHVVSWLTRVVSGYMVLSVLGFILTRSWTVFRYVQETLLVYQMIREELGPFNMLVLCVRRMLEPSVLACYWLTLFSAQVWSNILELVDKKYIIQETDWYVQGLVAMAEICESPLLLISFCIVVMLLSCGAILMTQLLLSTCGTVAGAGQPLVQSGVTEGVVAFVLGLQTGLTEMEMPGRVGALSIILFVVVASLLQSCLEITHPVLLSLPNSNRRFIRHLVPVTMTLSLFCLPLFMVYTLLTKVSSDMWTLVIISTCLVTAVQSIGNLITYALFVWDSLLTVPSLHMDDYVYYVKAGTKGVELLLAVTVVIGGFYESVVLDRDWSLLNSMVLISHCYFNIYSRVSQGWASYLARRETIERLSSLKVASSTDLASHSDICSICYQDMENPTAVITLCNHFFHKNCLKRWLVVQDNCPLCTKAIIAEENGNADNNLPHENNSPPNLEEDDIEGPTETSNENSTSIDNDEVQPPSGLRYRHVGEEQSVSPLFEGD